MQKLKVVIRHRAICQIQDIAKHRRHPVCTGEETKKDGKEGKEELEGKDAMMAQERRKEFIDLKTEEQKELKLFFRGQFDNVLTGPELCLLTELSPLLHAMRCTQTICQLIITQITYTWFPSSKG